MGLAIINQQANYTLERKAQNVIPVDESKRVYLTEVTNFNYEYAGNGIYRLKSLNIGNATQPYNYSLVLAANQSGVEIDPISGVVTVSSNFTGGNLKVQLNAIYSEYYPLNNGAIVFTAITNITDVQVPSVEPTITNNHLTITSFTYSGNPISASGGNSEAPTLTYSYTKIVNGQETTVSNTGGNVEYTIHTVSDSEAIVNSSSGVVTVPSNSAQFVKSYIVQAKVTVDDTFQTEVAKVTQAAAVVPTEVTYTYEFSDVSLSYSGTPVAATGNSTGLTPTLTYTLTKTGSDNSSESISASSIVYSVQGTKPTGVTLDTSNGKVTFAENGTDNLVQVTIQATLTAPDGTTSTPTATLTQNTRTLTGISFKSYNGANAINITTGNTINKSEISVNLIYDVGENGTGACTSIAVGGATGAQESSHQFTEAGNYPMRIYHNDLYVDVQVTVTTLTKAYISGFPEDPYPTSSLILSADGSMVSIPLKVLVMTPDSSTPIEKTFGEFLEMSPRETYDAPVVTFRGAFYDYCIPEKHNMVGANGTLNYDLTLDNYVYDKTRISSIALNCTSNSSADRSHTYNDVSIDMMSVYSSYFTDSNNFTSNVLINKPAISGSVTPTVAEGVTVLGGSGSGVGIHLSNTNTNLTNGLALTDSGYYYMLPQQESYLLRVVGSSCYVAIISTSDDTLSEGTNYKVNTWGNNIKVTESSSSTPKYIHHTPDANTNTFIIDLGNAYPLTWELLTPKNNE